MIFSIAMGAEYLFYMKSIETHASAFLALIILDIGTVRCLSEDNETKGGRMVKKRDFEAGKQVVHV